jgi:hypothetical protein
MKCIGEVKKTNIFGRKYYSCKEYVYIGKEKCEPEMIKYLTEKYYKK